jgi:hypothetical protein
MYYLNIRVHKQDRSIIIMLGGIKMELYENIPTEIHAILK